MSEKVHIPLLGGLLAGIAAEQTIVLSVPGMNCSVCPITVKKSLQKVEGVKSVNVTYENKTATVSFDNEQTDISSLTNATRNVGYPSHIKGSNK